MSFLIPFEFHKDDRLADFTVVKPVSRGGNGDLYLVRDDTEKLLVMKIVRKVNNDSELSGIEQSRAVSSHIPDLVPILKTGKLADGRVYCIMPPADNVAQWPEYKPDTLAERIRKNGRIPPDEVLEIMGRMLNAIKLLHDVGLAHCDIKPENILFIGGNPKLTDYSLLSEMAEHSAEVQNGTAGTIGFIPPEMIDNPACYNPRGADLYAVGKILYCAWTGNDVISFPSVPRDIPLQEIGIIRPLYMRACSVALAKRYRNADEFISAVEDARFRLDHAVSAHVRSNFRKNLPVLLLFFLALLCVIGIANIVLLLKNQSGKEKHNQDTTATGLFYAVIDEDDNEENDGKQTAPPFDPLIITTGLDVMDANDDVNSLREALVYAQRHGAGATLSFTGDFEIRLSSTLAVTQNVIIDAGTNKVTLIGPETEPMFQVADSRLTLKNMSLISDCTGDGGGILDVREFGRMDLYSVKDGGNAKLLWAVSHGFDINLNDGTHLHRMQVSPPVSGDGSHIKINAGTLLEDTTLAGCAGRRGGDYVVSGTLKNASVTEYGDIYVKDGGVCENITVKCTSFEPYMDTMSAVGGFVINSPGGKINGMKIEYGGVLGYEKDSVLTGTISIGGAVIAPVRTEKSVIDRETDLMFDLTERTGKNNFSFNYMTNRFIYYVTGNEFDTMIDNMKAFCGARSYAVKIRDDQAPGTYRLAANASGFSSPISLVIGEEVYSDVLSVGKNYSIGDTVYSLGLDNVSETGESSAIFFKEYNVLTLTIAARGSETNQ